MVLDTMGMHDHKKNRVSIAKEQTKKESIQMNLRKQLHEPHLILKSEGSCTGGKTRLKQDPKICLRHPMER